MSEKENTIYAVLERGTSGMYVMIIPEHPMPIYSGSIIKAVKKHIDLDKLITGEDLSDKIEIGKIKYNSNGGKIDSSDINVTNIVDNIEQKYALKM